MLGEILVYAGFVGAVICLMVLVSMDVNKKKKNEAEESKMKEDKCDKEEK